MDKTFGLLRPSSLIGKFQFDILRLGEARVTSEAQYAALDCASDAWHLVDWVLASVTEDRHLKLAFSSPHSKEAAAKFRDAHIDALPKLTTCQEIANSGKHLVLTRQRQRDDIQTSSSVKFNPPFNAMEGSWTGETSPTLHIYEDNCSTEAVEFFKEALQDWKNWIRTNTPDLIT